MTAAVAGRPLLVLPDLTIAPAERWLDALWRLPADRLAVQVRLPGEPAAALLRWGQTLRQVLGDDVPLIVNDRLDVAHALGAAGVHLGRQSVGVGEARALLGPGCWVSRACHDLDELALASREGADAALLSPVFASPGKGAPLGLDAVRAAAASLPRLALYALGGVDAASAPGCLQAGARGVAVVRAALDPEPWSASPWLASS
ncbi:MAG: thiamine phosphate synthase [Myxococcales bacterium]|nr:MAG: thiamine phosphate synthase [Myxococcales bacterium]